MAVRRPDWLEAADAELEIGFSSLQRRILGTYERSYANVSRELDALRAKIAAAPEIATITGSGTIQRGIPPSWILQQERYVRLQNELVDLVGNLSTELGREVPRAMRTAYELGLQSAEAAVGPLDPRVVPSSYASVPDDTIRRFLASSSQDPDRFLGSPLAGLLDTFRTEAGASAADYARDVLVNGLARGRALRSVASELEQGIRGMTASRALTIARTETLRAHREAHFQSYRRNEALVASWIWTAAVANNERPPCAACFAMHGSEHPLDERMETHPNCRCRMVPKRKAFRGIEPTGPATRIRPGAVEFRALPPGVARRVLGPTRYRAFVRNQFRFEELASYTENAWGRTLRVTPLRTMGLDRRGNRIQAPTAPLAPPPKMDRSALDAKIRGVEDEIVKNRKYETGVAFDDDGTILVDKRGAQYEVNFTDEETALMRGKTLVHNHPRAYQEGKLSNGDFVGGSSFSEQDVYYTGRYGITRIRAVSHGWRHELEWSPDWTPTAASVSDLRLVVQRADTAVRQEILPEINAVRSASNRRIRELLQEGKSLTSPEVRAATEAAEDATKRLMFEHNHRVWERVAAETGAFRYTREARQ